MQRIQQTTLSNVLLREQYRRREQAFMVLNYLRRQKAIDLKIEPIFLPHASFIAGRSPLWRFTSIVLKRRIGRMVRAQFSSG
ncbi:hypothetical protein [Pseudomonas sp. LP_7_YM]|uniref:hypothetical protein n=1 Tax=Pseudomonas sp. LP_7_YM TaxID=2485137 RepID=UPI001060EDFF|nr:hypothetical protein [Pseudomonas sp. LP_7_YM]TDV70123.1 hypothetical protein EC915_102388 [Pseudomonas sp. LP_7_YM]